MHGHFFIIGYNCMLSICAKQSKCIFILLCFVLFCFVFVFVLGREGRERSGRNFRGKTSFELCVFFVVLLCVCVVLGRGGRSMRSVEEVGSTLVSSF